MSNKCIVFTISPKLVSMDNTLPLLLEIKEKKPDYKFFLVYYNIANKEEIAKNNLLKEGIKYLNCKEFVLRKNNLLSSLFSIMIFLLHMIGKEIIILKDKDLFPKHRKLMKVLTFLGRVKEYLLNLRFSDEKFYLMAQYEYINLNPKYSKLDKLKKNDYDNIRYDKILSYLDKDVWTQFYSINVSNESHVKLNSLKKSFTYIQLLEKVFSKKEKNIEKYMVYYLSPFGKRMSYMQEVETDVLIEESLSVLNKFSNRFKVILKPHPATDVNTLEKIIKRAGIKNYEISFEHHILLAKDAEFILCNMNTSVLNDIIHLNKYILSYNDLDKRVVEKFGEECFPKNVIDFNCNRNKEKLELAINEVLEKEIKEKGKVTQEINAFSEIDKLF